MPADEIQPVGNPAGFGIHGRLADAPDTGDSFLADLFLVEIEQIPISRARQAFAVAPQAAGGIAESGHGSTSYSIYARVVKTSSLTSSLPEIAVAGDVASKPVPRSKALALAYVVPNPLLAAIVQRAPSKNDARAGKHDETGSIGSTILVETSAVASETVADTRRANASAVPIPSSQTKTPAAFEVLCAAICERLIAFETSFVRECLAIADMFAEAKGIYEATTGTGHGHRRPKARGPDGKIERIPSFAEAMGVRLERSPSLVAKYLRIASLDAETRAIITPRIGSNLTMLLALSRASSFEVRAEAIAAHSDQGQAAATAVLARAQVGDPLKSLAETDLTFADLLRQFCNPREVFGGVGPETPIPGDLQEKYEPLRSFASVGELRSALSAGRKKGRALLCARFTSAPAHAEEAITVVAQQGGDGILRADTTFLSRQVRIEVEGNEVRLAVIDGPRAENGSGTPFAADSANRIPNDIDGEDGAHGADGDNKDAPPRGGTSVSRARGRKCSPGLGGGPDANRSPSARPFGKPKAHINSAPAGAAKGEQRKAAI